MAGIISQTLIRSSFRSASPRFLTQRHRSNQSGKAQLIEVDLDSSSSSSSSNDDVEVLGIRKLEDVIHNIIVKRSAPDWLPFRPGSSYWVPPPRSRRPQGVSQILAKLTNPLSHEESLSLSTFHGWPASSFFFQDTSSTHQVPKELKVQVVKIENDSEDTPQSEDEE